ncbi:MAG: N-methyl-L-tryptophan oxidase [Anaerolineae bacterium]|nr:N-methyl-L-tryptophan oxidase [Thermoflexales bacterium]MDW8395835.1 N-methyl-L-tryptophan oxidase [Anaerolineae bacterium]
MTDYEFIVIGAGAMGSATAYHLAKDKRRVLLLEQFEIGHARGSSHGESRIFRFAYPQPAYARLAMQSKPLWAALETDCDERLLLPTGGMDIADDPSGFDSVHTIAATLAELGAQYEVLDAARFSARFPQFKISPDGIAVYSPDAGVLLADRCVRAAVRVAQRLGAAVHECERVHRILPEGSRVLVETEHGRYRAKGAIVTAGAWVNTLLASLGLALPVTIEKEQVAYFDTRSAAAFKPPHWTIWIHYRAEIAYGFPDLGSGLKAGFHHAGHYLERADDNNGVPDQGDLDRLSQYVRERFPALDPIPRNGLTCLYTNAPDHDFIIDPLPGAPNVWLASPCSGHGFKFAVGIGRALADLAQHGETQMSVAHTRRLAALLEARQ